MIDKIKKIIALCLMVLVLALPITPVMAIEAPSAPAAPTIQSVPPPPPPPPPPSAPEAPSLNSTSTVESASSPEAQQTTNQEEPKQQEVATTSNSSPSPSPTPSPTPTPLVASPGGQTQSGNGGDTLISTGDTTNTGNITTLSNNNLAASGETAGGGGAVVENIGNGSESSNDSSATVTNNSTSVQDNLANIGNNLDLATTTGANTASRNVGDSVIATGDANTTGTVVTGVNTNVAGVAVSEFNIADDHKGDIILDFASNCISGCQNFGNNTVANMGNGSDSTNIAELNQISNNDSFQNNDATVESNLTLASNSGDNQASQNTGGDSLIQTGDANVAANVLTFANNNVLGGVVYGVVNIFGNLVGDIILPDEFLATLVQCADKCGQDTNVVNSGNGSGSTNEANVNTTQNDTTFQSNDANIENNLILAANTGDNTTSQNTGGVSYVNSGEASAQANVLNVANSNVSGGVWWLVIVNEAGKWVGKILGAPDGSNMAGSEGTQFSVNDKGEVVATNTGNGAGSDNNTNVNQQSNTTNIQNNTANIVNNLNLFANSGGNSAKQNTGGDSVVKTGDADIIASIVNFVNNNIVGQGKLGVVVVNVFGSWVGDFITPGHKKEVEQAQSNTADQGSPDNSQTNNNNQQTLPQQQQLLSSGSSDNSNTTATIPSSEEDANTSSRGSETFVAKSIRFATTVSGGGLSGGENVVQVAGFKAETLGEAMGLPIDILTNIADKQVMKVNLAWIILAIPVLLLTGLALKVMPFAKIAARFRSRLLRN